MQDESHTKLFNEVCYTGGIYDSTTGLYYLNARYYNPEDGRFLTEDTYRGETKEPDTWHLYAYCANNPINYIDPSGHKAIRINKFYTGFSYNKKGKYFYSAVNCWQRKFGYNNYIDIASRQWGCNIKWIKSYFTYKNKKGKKKKWRIELWKGNYGVTIGAEIGLYYKSYGSKIPHYSAVSNNDMMEMSYQLYYKKLSGKRNKILQRNKTKHWWLNGFKIGHAPIISRLEMKASIKFPNKGMAKAFKNNLSKKSVVKKVSGREVKITW